MNIEGVVIPGTKGRYGRAKVIIHVLYNGYNKVYGEEYMAFALSKHGLFIEMGRTLQQAIKQAEKKAVLFQNLIIEERKQKAKKPK
ncbi:hypothetical protein FIU87_05380 [Bacillus sp. THAF10]|uniref:hypothetical protein n=1 Tax=Bacillus sp. THAF10 TaxID=2587848 RepID=UPI001267CD5D|nr:hypothetical protein [Bacillus sp. THAF10]QFT88065.1 hypothetical protein FIU87_05380 [Bacillus sp. THAF10]